MNLFPKSHVEENLKIDALITILKLTGRDYKYDSESGLRGLSVYFKNGYLYGKIIYFTHSRKLIISADKKNVVMKDFDNYIESLDEFIKDVLELTV